MKHKIILVLTINNIIMADIQLTVGQLKTAAFKLYNATTGALIPGAVFSNQQVGANSNPASASFVLNSSNPSFVNQNGLAVGSGTIVFTATAQYTDPGDGLSHTEPYSVTKNFTVTGTANGATLDVV